ncbi:GDSL-type esterase/lipase family protein [[Empedobacter] haloabium]|uniref:GDSL-type esterase/lipase family protein n=1 Tax=[Empedobacter] haloabium TaxID=592317 RepID=A0ABZ1UFR2_9BURK
MRFSLFPFLVAAGALPALSFAAPLAPAVLTLQVQARPDVPNLECERRAPAQPRPAAAANPDPLEVPDEEVVRELADTMQAGAAATSPGAPLPAPGARIAIWGDSHLAAAFFSDELARQLKVPADNVSNLLLPANMGRAGVRLPIRRTCVSPQWKYEPAYLGGDKAVAPGPGLVNMTTEQAGASIAWDVRNDKRVANHERVRILYQQTAAPTVVGISVDGAPETQVTLEQQPGPAVLELAAGQPISQVRMRLIAGPMRLHGLDLQASRAGSLAMDVFGYPGATVAGWKPPQLDYLASWFGQRDYQLVMLEFGTNEGAARPFDSAGYRRTLEESVRNLRTVFPQAACVLIAPGDRGVLVPQSVNRGKRKGKGKAKAAPKIDLYVYSRVHAEIGRLQREVGAAAGCATWSMMDAMGGPGSAYKWARQSPPLMARDLIHFTVAGYQRFARDFARDMGWAVEATK